MSESSNGVTPDPAPLPPRWNGIQSLSLVHQLNERCIGLLCDLAVADARDATLPIIAHNRDLWIHLELEARQKAARIPFVIVDAQFKNEEWWRRAAESHAHESGAEEPLNGLPREASEHLMHELTIFAWQTARWDRTVAQISFGMSASVVDLIAALTPQQVRAIATQESQSMRVRWADDPRFWQDLLMAAKAGDDEKLAEIHLHAKLLLCGELAQLSF